MEIEVKQKRKYTLTEAGRKARAENARKRSINRPKKEWANVWIEKKLKAVATYRFGNVNTCLKQVLGKLD